MKTKTLVLVVIALGCGLVASIGISQVMGKKTKPAAQPKAEEKVKILVATTDLDIGATITEDDVKLKTWPKEDAPEGALTEIKQLDGLFPRVRLSEGMPIVSRFLSSKININIPDGMRVIPVKISANQVFGRVQPGDHVDVSVFLRIKDSDTQKETSLVRTVLKDVRLYGVNTQIDRIMRDGKKVSVRTAELLLTPAQVNLVTLAEESGTLRLSLRKFDDKTGDDQETLATIRDLLGRPAEDATVEKKKPETNEKPDSFKNFLEDMTGEPRTDVVEPLHKMIIHTPDGLIEYRWNDPNQVPEVARVGFGPGAIPAPGTAPTQAPAKQETKKPIDDGDDEDDEGKMKEGSRPAPQQKYIEPEDDI